LCAPPAPLCTLIRDAYLRETSDLIAETASRLFLFMFLRGQPRKIVWGVHVHLAAGEG